MNDLEYKGYYITTGDNTYTVQCDGEDCNFDTEEDAKEFIDGMTTEDHFDDKEDGIEPEDPGYDEDEVLNEEDHLGEAYYRVWYTDFDTGEEKTQDVWGRDNFEVRRMVNPQGRISKIKMIGERSKKRKSESTEKPYTTKDLANGIVDLLNSDTLDWNTGVYENREDALFDLVSLSVFDELSEDELDAIIEDEDYATLKAFVISHPDQAEKMFNTVADVFGFSNYRDYQTYLDWVSSGEEDEYYEDIYDEATNPGAITSVPGKHIRIDLDEEDEEDS